MPLCQQLSSTHIRTNLSTTILPAARARGTIRKQCDVTTHPPQVESMYSGRCRMETDRSSTDPLLVPVQTMMQTGALDEFSCPYDPLTIFFFTP
ncbi:hypothetical protein AAFF_G00416840 [Aldrovandia affinis]|uniref:Uncharacterized protein n=1 Tax=Aldrovandia affinis TaxID=143900 RepID=A0AAD7SAH1_9TELE|nr:hypothetical protein AAFF_G00416840 [Aldrovandia affinis]